MSWISFQRDQNLSYTLKYLSVIQVFLCPHSSSQKIEAMDAVRLKIILLGDATVGKTSLAHHQATGVFDLTSLIQIDDRTVKLMLWDTAGQEQFAWLVPM
jgi:GTPase SAR1 family protein